MSEIANNEGASETEKPAQNDVKFPPFPEPTDKDFDEDISEEERTYYKNKFKDLNDVKTARLHCTSCDRHLGCSARNERMRAHPMLRTLVCHSCHTFYNSGEFEKGDDGSELYCRWCGQGGQVYCCSDCPHVFCAKCIKRNLGVPKIKEIENADDWKCFKCNPECLMNLRAICWAVLRYCDLKNKITYLTEDPELKAALQKECALDPSECCKHKTNKRNQRINDSLPKKKEIKKEADAKLAAANIISKMPATIQVKKFASVNPDDSNKVEKKAQKRPASPKLKSLLVKNPVSIAPNLTPKIFTTSASVPSLPKKLRLPTIPIKFPNVRDNKSLTTYTRIRPKLGPQLPIPIINNCFNGFSTNVFQCPNPINDNINLSLESLTQGLDMTAVAAMSNNNSQDDDVVCTPDFPLEPLCEVTEDNDDDVECITPGPVVTPKMVNPPPLVPRSAPNISDVTAENIIQMTENDVTVNEATGGLKFRVDPQTLSSNKMYRLPDGRIFAINSNPNMPGGYSATIVAVTEANKGVPKGPTFAAKLSSVSTSTPAPKSNRNQVTRFVNTKRITPKAINVKSTKTSETSTRECDLTVPVEWYRYNLIDAVDALEYSLSRLQKLKKDATSVYLRTRSINEMRNLHRTLERLLNTSSSRFNEIRENLNKGLKQYVQKKSSGGADGGGATSEEDDDVEILPDIDDDPIFIDENSVESNMNGSENQEVDLTGPGSSEYNDSSENRTDISLNDPHILGETTGQLINIRSLQDISKNVEDSGNKVNGVHSTRMFSDLKCKSVEDINRLAAESSNEKNAKSKNVEDNDASVTNLSDEPDNQVKHETVQDTDDKMEISDDKDQSSDNNLQNSDGKLKNSKDKLQDSSNEVQDSDNKVQDSDDKVQDSDDKVQDSDDKLQDSVDKIQDSDDKDSDDKLQDPNDKLQDSDAKLQEPNDKGHDSDEKMLDDDTNEVLAVKNLNDADKKHNSDANTENLQDNLEDSNDLDFKMQDAENKIQDTDDKMPDTEMSEEMIETLLKDDNSEDSATTNSEISKVLSVI